MFPILLGKNNNLEKRVKTLEDSGGGGSNDGVLVVTADNNGKLDKTWQEIHDAAFSVLKDNDGHMRLGTEVFISDNVFVVGYWSNGSPDYLYFITDSADTYPILAEEN